MAERGTIDAFKSNVAADFARPNLFQVDINFPGEIISQSGGLVDLAKFTIRAANLPASQIGVIEVPFRGSVLKIAGDRTFEPWTITVQNDSKFLIRSAFEKWAQAIQAYERTLLLHQDYIHQMIRLVTLQTWKFINFQEMIKKAVLIRSSSHTSSIMYSHQVLLQ